MNPHRTIAVLIVIGAALAATAGPVLGQDAAYTTLTVAVDEPLFGTVTFDPPGGSYLTGDWVTLTAVPADGYRFVRWSGDLTAYDTVLTVAMTQDTALTATFEPDVYELTLIVDPSGAGAIALDPHADAYAPGSSVKITAMAGPGYAFEGWSGDVIENTTSNGLTITVTDDMDIVANFASAASVTPDAAVAPSSRTSGLCGSVGMVSMLTLSLTMTTLVLWRRAR